MSTDLFALAEVLYRSRVKDRGPVHITGPEYDWAADVLASDWLAQDRAKQQAIGRDETALVAELEALTVWSVPSGYVAHAGGETAVQVVRADDLHALTARALGRGGES